MDRHETGLSPPQRLAIVYAPKALQPLLSLLLEFDARFADIVARSTEPLIGQMKLAWWRDAIAARAGARPKGEPLMAQLDAVSGMELAPALSQLVDAWELLLIGDDIEGFAKIRGQAVFTTYAKWTDSTVDVAKLGATWAAASIGACAIKAQPIPVDRNLRPLTILALSVRDVSGPRLLWHALTGR